MVRWVGSISISERLKNHQSTRGGLKLYVCYCCSDIWKMCCVLQGRQSILFTIIFGIAPRPHHLYIIKTVLIKDLVKRNPLFLHFIEGFILQIIRFSWSFENLKLISYCYAHRNPSCYWQKTGTVDFYKLLLNQILSPE